MQQPDRLKLAEGEVAGCELVAASCNTPALLDLVEELFLDEAKPTRMTKIAIG